MDFSKHQLAEKQFVSVKFSTCEYDDTIELDVITGDFDNDALSDIENSLDHVDFIDTTKCLSTWLWSHIKEDYTTTRSIEIGVLQDSLTISIEPIGCRGGFMSQGCDICNDGLGNDVTECIAYKDATTIDKGEYLDIEVCGACLCEYFNGE